MKKGEQTVNFFENSIGPWLGKTVKMIDYFLQESFESDNLDITKEQMIVLKKLYNQDGLYQNELARLIFRNKSSLARLLSKMESKNYISRKSSKEDKRIKKVFLTDTGKEVFEKAIPIIKNMLSKMEETITSDEKEQMITILKKVQHNFGANQEHL
ncbi:MarR family winged helix-turn-helix transcriptional regulator [Tenacibaculum sp. M341]|uniref:MarR family winged helix-turn-helix transcriptional regulator n=1 Tax=Tenacibaculum sp. M341 TaxID=2530339 RepID=UPI001045F5C9|nr:MarR family transcriptional regulator [Tenacibaculum sp. M341]TCI93559.1 MarR family transcriptional regulator [Tenacibaculum sp. M341]